MHRDEFLRWEDLLNGSLRPLLLFGLICKLEQSLLEILVISSAFYVV